METTNIDIQELITKNIFEKGELKALSFDEMSEQINFGQIAAQIPSIPKEKLAQRLAEKGLAPIDYVFLNKDGIFKAVNVERQIVATIIHVKMDDAKAKYVILDL